MLWLLIFAFIALSLLATLPWWLRGRRVQGVLWLLACLVGPAIVFVVSLVAMSHAPAGDGSPGEGLGILFVSGLVASGAWALLSLVALISAPRRS